MATESDGTANQSVHKALHLSGAVGSAVVFTYLGYLLFDAPAYGLAAGILSGIGSYLLLKYFVHGGEDEADVESLTRPDTGGIHVGAAGMALDGAAAAALVWGITEAGSLLLGLPLGLAFAVVLYVVLERVLPRDPREFEDS